MGGAVKDVLDKGDIGGCESLRGSAPKFPATFQLDLFDLCTPGQVTGTRHWIELGLQEIVRTDNSNHCFWLSLSLAHPSSKKNNTEIRPCRLAAM